MGFRAFTKNPNNIKELNDKGKKLEDLWKERGKIDLDEVKILEHVAYKARTGGGVKEQEITVKTKKNKDIIELKEKEAETLIIKGMISRDDKEGISIRSSINSLSDRD